MIHSIKIVHVTNGIRRVHFARQKLMRAIIQFHLVTTPTTLTVDKPNEFHFFLFAYDFIALRTIFGFQALLLVPRAFIANKYTRSASIE